MSNLSDLLPAGAGGKQVDFVASGTLGSGVTVALRADGTVEAVGVTPEGAGTAVVFESASSSYISATYDSTNNKVVIAYIDAGNSSYGTAIVGTVSGTSISFGTAVVFESASSNYISATYDSTNGKIVIAYKDQGNSSFGTAIVGTVSGTSISFGTAVVFQSGNSNYNSATYDSTNNKVVIASANWDNSRFGTAIVGTVSGTAISFGTAVVFESAQSDYISATYDSTNGKVVIAYRDAGNSSYGTAIVGTVSGTAISFGTPVVFESASSSYISATYDSTNNKVVIAYSDAGNSSYGTAIVGTVSGTSISFGTAVVFESAQSAYISATYDSTNGKVVIAYRDAGNSSYGTAIVGTVSGTSISFGTAVVFESASSSYISATYDSTNGKIVIAYKDQGNSSFGTAVVYSLASSNNTSFIGITDAAISSAASGSVTIKGGISTNVTGLTANSTYYVQSDGTLSTASSSVLAGKALSSTSINLDYTT
jgi:hypothetical protein